VGYLTSFKGHWQNLDLNALESLANKNYALPRPRPIDPALLFDLFKIRRNVDEAASLAVTATSVGGGGGPKLSRERQHRMRVLATQKLAKAYMLDDIAASLMAMTQAASTLERVATFVLQREERNEDAEYVHFFHEKIPSCTVDPEHFSLAPLDRVVDAKPYEGALLRTRALAKAWRGEFQEAMQDLTKALQLLDHRRHGVAHAPTLEQGKKLLDEEMPSSLEGQLLFYRAGSYLSLALLEVQKVFATTKDVKDPVITDYRRTVRKYAKDALKDYMRFLAGLDYCPAAGEAVVSISTLVTSVATAAEKDASVNWAFTHHPLMTDALYSILLCHLFLATPRKELERYVSVVERLVRIAATVEFFRPPKSPARADWIEVVKEARLGFGFWEDGLDKFLICEERVELLVQWVGKGWGGVPEGQKKKKQKKKKKAEVPVSEIQALTL
jgi:hypothetical protein